MEGIPAFSLDIGTRKVVGLLTAPAARGGLRIVAADKMEHRTRSMYDGQVHDVVEVAGVVGAIKARLEQRTGLTLRDAAVAAAGRALRTFRGTGLRMRPPREPIGADEAFALELEAIQDAQRLMAETLRNQEQAHDYIYVGHSALERRLDGVPLVSLVGQRGAAAALDVIATFLPRGVVDSLVAVLERVGLEMTALTLEPIAAIGAVIPPSMRHLNLVLVDIGAGTSDIAITHRGTITAYDMVPVAGDEVTECLSEQYLLDFNVAESVKRQLSRKERVTWTDVLGRKRDLPAAEVAAAILPAVQDMAGRIAERVLRHNGRPPQAVVLVGGGSQAPGLPGCLAGALGIAPDRVAVRGRDAIKDVVGGRPLLDGPDAVTPIGIAVAAREQTALGFAYVHVDGAGVRLFHPSRLTVADALLAAGYSVRDLQPRLGRGMTVTVNGELRLVPGKPGKAAQLRVNGEPATLDSRVHHRDSISVVPAQPGEPGRARVADLLPDLRPLQVTLNGAPREVPPQVSVGAHQAAPDLEVHDNDVITARRPEALAEVLAALGVAGVVEAVEVRYRLGGVVKSVRRPAYRLALDGLPADPASRVHDGARLEVAPAPPLTVREVAGSLFGAGAPGIRVRVNGAVMELRTLPRVTRNGRPAGPDDPVLDGDVLEAEAQPGAQPIFADCLARMGISPTPPPGRTRLAMSLNGAPADFVSPLQDGDEVLVTWE